MTDNNPLLSLDQVAEILSCSRDTVRRMIARGEVPATRIGQRLIRIRQSDLNRAMKPVTSIGRDEGASEL